jgi:hypothetical protein
MDYQLNITHEFRSIPSSERKKLFVTQKKWYFVCKNNPSFSIIPASDTNVKQQIRHYNNCKKYNDFCSAIDYYNTKTEPEELRLITTSNIPLSVENNSTYNFKETQTYFL